MVRQPSGTAPRGKVASRLCSSPPASTHSSAASPTATERRAVHVRPQGRETARAAPRWPGDAVAVAQQPVGEVDHRASRPPRRPVGPPSAGRGPQVVGRHAVPYAAAAGSARVGAALEQGQAGAPSARASRRPRPVARAGRRCAGPAARPAEVTEGGHRHHRATPAGADDRSPPATTTPAPAAPSPSAAGELDRPVRRRRRVGDQRHQHRGRRGAHRGDVGEVLGEQLGAHVGRRSTTRRASRGRAPSSRSSPPPGPSRCAGPPRRRPARPRCRAPLRRTGRSARSRPSSDTSARVCGRCEHDLTSS